MPILYGLLFHQTVGIVSICYLSLCLISSLRNILFVSPGLVLLLFHSQFLLFKSPFESQRNVSSSLTSCLSIFLMYCPCSTLLLLLLLLLLLHECKSFSIPDHRHYFSDYANSFPCPLSRPPARFSLLLCIWLSHLLC